MTVGTATEPATPPRLRRVWLAVTLAGALGVLAGAVAVERLRTPAAAVGWGAIAAAVAGFEAGFLRAHLDANRPRPDAPPLATLGAGTLLTLGRGFCFAAVAGFLLLAADGALADPAGVLAWAPGLLYGAGALADWFDGLLARRYDHETILGAKLDMAVDTTGFLVAPLVGVVAGHLPVAYLSIGFARYLFRAGTWLRRRRGLSVGDLPPSRVRRPLAGLQMAVITAALLPVLPRAVVHPAALVAMTPTLLLFLRDWLVVSGRLSVPAG